MSSLTSLDNQLFLAVNELAGDSAWLHGAVVSFAKYGVILFGIALVFGALYSRRHTARTSAAAVWAGLGTLLAIAVNQPIGNAIHEARPYTAYPHALVLVTKTSDFSFPSDHAVMAGAVAAGLFLVSRRLGLVTAAVAVAMAAARVYVGAHYPWDVVAGLALGAGVVLLGWLVAGPTLTRLVSSLRTTRLRPLLVAGSGADRPAAFGQHPTPSTLGRST